jgi:indolepyruvate ferredoxin oxidoreductase beta subunit
VRYGQEVFSPMVPLGQADFLLVLAPDQVENNRFRLRDGGVLIDPGAVDVGRLANRRSLNIALLGRLSRHLEIPDAAWADAIRAHLPQRLHDLNLEAFALGRNAACPATATL